MTDAEALDEIAEILRAPEWNAGYIEAVASIVSRVRDVESRNRYSHNNEERVGPDVVDGQDWDIR